MVLASKENNMKSWYLPLAALLSCGMPSYVSADEFLSGRFEDSMSERIHWDNKADLWFANSYLNAPHLHLTSARLLSPGGVEDAPNNTVDSSGRISTSHHYLELTPMWGYAFDGEFDDEETGETIEIADESTFGFRLAFDYDYNSQIEFLYSHQETKLSTGDLFPREALYDLDVYYYHIGGSLFWGRGSELEPHFTGTMGLTYFNPEDSGLDSLTRFSMGFGGGVRYFPLERVGLYTGVRGLVTFVDSDIMVYSGSGGSFAIVRADDVWQFQVYAGLIFVF
jgi:hypothetical protein